MNQKKLLQAVASVCGIVIIETPAAASLFLVEEI